MSAPTACLGRDLLALLGDRARGVDIDDIDITSLESTERLLRTLNPAIVINCAAYTDVDGCETNVETAMQVNGEGVAHLAMSTRMIGARLVQISTDYIFDGGKGSPYLEDDAPNPLSIYGESKLCRRAERRLQSRPSDCAHPMAVWPARQEFCRDHAAAGG